MFPAICFLQVRRVYTTPDTEALCSNCSRLTVSLQFQSEFELLYLFILSNDRLGFCEYCFCHARTIPRFHEDKLIGYLKGTFILDSR